MAPKTTTPREQVAALMAECDAMSMVSAAHDEAGNETAAIAALDQAEACDRDAERVARASGDPDLAALWVSTHLEFYGQVPDFQAMAGVDPLKVGETLMRAFGFTCIDGLTVCVVRHGTDGEASP